MLELCVHRPCGREDAGQVLAGLVAEFGLKSTPATVTLARADYETQYVELPGIADEELREALAWKVAPPGVLDASEIVTTGVRLSNDRGIGMDGAPPVRATVMAASTLERVTNAVIGAGLELQAVYPREMALVALTRRQLSADGPSTRQPDTEPPVVSVFVGPRSSSITVTRGDRLYLSRTIHVGVPPETGLDEAARSRLAQEVLRTAENFNKRLSNRAVSVALLGPEIPGIDRLRHQLTSELDATVKPLGRPADLEAADESTANTAATQAGLLALAGLYGEELPDTASVYQRPPRHLSATSPPVLAAGVVAGCLALAAISGVQSFMLSQAEDRLSTARDNRDALQIRVTELQEATDGLETVEPSADLLAQRERLEARRDFYTTIIEDFEGVDTSLKAGFSEPLKAIARASVDGLWLRQIRIEPDRIQLQGQALGLFEAETLASELPEQPAFAHWSPESIDIGDPRDHERGVTVRRFSISGEGLVADANGNDTETDPPRRQVDGIQALLRGLRDADG